jgi:hypothetical protein
MPTPSVMSEPRPTPAPLCLQGTTEFDVEAAGETAGGSGLPRFRMVAYTGGPMRVAGWRHPVILDLAGLAIPSQARPIRFAHDPTSGVGHTDSLRVEGGVLVATGVISRDTPTAREVVTSSKNGFPWQASIGAAVEEFEFVREGQAVTVNGRSFVGPTNVVRKSTLGEISFVDLGADGATSANVLATASPSSGVHSMDAEFSPTPNATTTVAPTAVPPTTVPPLQAANPPMVEHPVTPAPAAAPSVEGTGSPARPVEPVGTPAGLPQATVAELRSQAAAEVERIAAVRRHFSGRWPQLEAQAIREGWSEQRAELTVLRELRPTAPAVHLRDNTVNSTVLEAACLLSSKYAGVEQLFEPQTLDLAARRFRGGIGLQELLLEAAWANGYSGRNFRDSRAVLRSAFGRDVEAAYSTIDIGQILATVSNKFLLEGFFSVERVWRNICAVRNVTDFKTVTSYRLIGKDTYEQVAPGGELKHGTLGNETYTNKADTYGLMLSIDRRDIINDDLGAITTVPRKLGRGSGLKINDVFWSVFLNNAAFFTAANKTLLTGADTTLTIDGLTKAEVAFMDQVDSDNQPIGLMPAILLVPTSLSAVASQLFKSLELRDNTPNAKFPITNPHQGKYRVEVGRYLANSRFSGNSSKAWYLLAEPSDLPVIEVAFLNGQESPTIETADADFNVLGIQMRGFHDFGVSLQDYRGGIRCKGEA